MGSNTNAIHGKKSKSFRFSDRVSAILEAQDNATKFLEKLVLDSLKPSEPDGPDLISRIKILNNEILARIDTLEATVLKAKSVTPQPTIEAPNDVNPTTGYPCCAARKPCKHWQFDGGSGVWTNTVSGAVREAV